MSDSLLCRCGSIEDNQHYFFYCMHYQRERHELLNEIARYATPILKKGKRKVQGMPQSQIAALLRQQEEEETDKTKQAQI